MFCSLFIELAPYLYHNLVLLHLCFLHNLVIKLSGENPSDAAKALDEHLRSILESVKLVYLLEREGGWDANLNWEDILSLGEQQRLGMVSLILELFQLLLIYLGLCEPDTRFL